MGVVRLLAALDSSILVRHHKFMSRTRKIFLFVVLPLLIVFGVLMLSSLGGKVHETNDISGNESASTQNKDCPALVTPVDKALVSSVLYPGQVRGGDFKPHGGFRMSNIDNNLVKVKAPLDAKVTNGSRYIEMGEVQYMFDFKTDCGLEYRFDHLKTLSVKLQAAADKLPEAKVDDSQTSRIFNVGVEAGELIATEVGFSKSPAGAPEGPNVSFDFGLYDKRQKNEASKDSAWVTAHKEEGDQAIYAVCWLDWLLTSDAAVLKSLPGGDGQSGKQSDYCK